MQLLYLVVILIAPYALLSVAGWLRPALAFTRRQRARIALSVFFAFTGIGHFIKTDVLVAMMPPAVPFRVELVYVTGILELLGAIGIWLPRWRRLTGALLILMLVAFLPVNIYAAIMRVDFGGHELGPAYLLARIPVQLLLIAGTWFAAMSAEPQRSGVNRS